MTDLVTYIPNITITEHFAFYSIDRIDVNQDKLRTANEILSKYKINKKLYEEFAKEQLKTFKTNFYYEQIKYTTGQYIHPESTNNYLSYKEFKEQKLHTAYKRLLLTQENQQLKYAVLYCNHTNNDTSKIARDIMFNQDRLKINNIIRLRLILEGEGTTVLALMK